MSTWVLGSWKLMFAMAASAESVAGVVASSRSRTVFGAPVTPA